MFDFFFVKLLYLIEYKNSANFPWIGNFWWTVRLKFFSGKANLNFNTNLCTVRSTFTIQILGLCIETLHKYVLHVVIYFIYKMKYQIWLHLVPMRFMDGPWPHFGRIATPLLRCLFSYFAIFPRSGSSDKTHVLYRYLKIGWKI